MVFLRRRSIRPIVLPASFYFCGASPYDPLRRTFATIKEDLENAAKEKNKNEPRRGAPQGAGARAPAPADPGGDLYRQRTRRQSRSESTRLNSSHEWISRMP